MLTVTRHGITSRFDASPWPDGVPRLYRPFLENRFYEQGLLDHIRRLKLRGVYIDVGACFGTHTVWFALYCPSTFVHAFEPRQRFAEWTRMNIEANSLGSKVKVHQLGLSDQCAEASPTLDGRVETFPVERLDRVVAGASRGRARVAVIKVDVEGMEELVLRGAQDILKRDRPVIFAEAFTDRERAVIEAVLAPYGYRATGRVFNATPTYEFAARLTLRHRALGAAHRLRTTARRALRRARFRKGART
jgi:FkbM family methyltransferase